jgi:hypothetical protein
MRLKNGPAPVEMAPLLGKMQAEGAIQVELRRVGGFNEERIVARVHYNLRYFGPDDMRYVDAAIQYYWNATANEASDDSHGIAWQSREDGDPMPYELAYLSNAKASPGMLNRLSEIANERGWKSE